MSLRPPKSFVSFARLSRLICLGWWLTTILPVAGYQPQTFQFTVQNAIPDGDLAGLADAHLLPPGPAPIESITVTLALSPAAGGGFLGDLFVSLTRLETGYTVLLNRPGRSSRRPFGYSDGVPVRITFDDEAAYDIHKYRSFLTGNDDLPLDTPLTGVWQPDGRTNHPNFVLETDLRAAPLSDMSGLSQEGTWMLFLADVSTGGAYILESWSLEVRYVPEARVSTLLSLALLSAWLVRRFRRRTAPSPRVR
ncbi:PEP-CTERM sorting domain-containing protein [Limisphaera sp. 4302-co]|uniref:PEP-CTERM sorting domain-containing protein n=1 Tax=Limisphaera sp. 4302-co TaxID=3400417 RepID=UPI003C141BBD